MRQPKLNSQVLDEAMRNYVNVLSLEYNRDHRHFDAASSLTLRSNITGDYAWDC